MDLSGESADVEVDVTKTVITSEGCVETAQKTSIGFVEEPTTVEKAAEVNEEETTPKLPPVVASNPSMIFVPVENADDLMAAAVESNPSVVGKKRKAMSEETKAAMAAKRKATMAAKKAAAIATPSGVDAKLAAMTVEQLEGAIEEIRAKMKDAVASEEFEAAALLKKEVVKHIEAITHVKGEALPIESSAS